MGMSTRSKTGARLTPAKTIDKPQPSRHPKGKKGARSVQPKAKPEVGGSAGSRFPENVTLLTDTGVHVNTGELLTDQFPGFVLFTYPRANTPGCTTQACNMRDALPDFSKIGYNVFGLSYDKPKGQAGWRAKHNLGYTLLCDTLDAGVIKMLGAHKAPKGIKRSVFVIRKDPATGKPTVVYSQIGVSPKDSVPLVKEYVEKNPATASTEKMEDKSTEEENKEEPMKEEGKKDDKKEEKKEEPKDAPNGS